MEQQIVDRNWQQLQDNVTNFFTRHMQGDTQKIEYKPIFRIQFQDAGTERALEIRRPSL